MILNKTKISAVILGVIAGLTLAGFAVSAHTNECHVNCHTSTPSPTIPPFPTPHECWEDCKTPSPTDSPTASPSATPVEATPTENPNSSLTVAAAPELPSCTAPTWIPVVTYLGQVGNTFTYSWDYPDKNVTQFWVNYGYTPDTLVYSELVNGNQTSITMDHAGMNWIQVFAYSNGCLGKGSQVTN